MVFVPGHALEYLIGALQKCRQTQDVPLAKQLHAFMRQHCLVSHRVLGNYLVPVLVDCGSLPDAQRVFDGLPCRNEHSWSSLITGYVDSGELQRALHLYHHMHQDHVLPNSYTFVALLGGCTAAKDIEAGRVIHVEIIKQGMEGDLFISNTLIDMFGKCGVPAEARSVFEKLLLRDEVSWNAIISSYADHELGDDALGCFDQMQVEGVLPADVTFASILKACGSIGSVQRGQLLCAEVAKLGLENDLFVGSSMVDMYVKCGLLPEAQKVFDNLPGRDAVSWTTLIAGYSEHGFGEEALNVLERMQLEKVSPVAVTFTCSLKACGLVGALKTGLDLHAKLTQRGLDKGLSVVNTLVDMYAKCGLLVEARDTFDKLPIKSVVSWTAMISGYGENLEGDMAIQCFKEMLEQDVKPNAITFLCLLAACSQMSLVLTGQDYFNVMKEAHEVEPTEDHYACMVDLLARSGHVYEAEKLTDAMWYLPTAETLRSLLTACKTHGEVELGLRCFQQLVKLSHDL